MDYNKDIIAASIDILGLGNVLKYNGSKKAFNLLNKLFLNTIDPYVYSAPLFLGKKIRVFKDSVRFGDSVYIFGEPKNSIQNQVEHLIFRAVSLLALGIYKHNFFLRCGIAGGDLLTGPLALPKDVPQHLIELSENIFIGTSISHANQLEKNQNWIGGAISKDIDCSHCMKYLVEYDIPLKNKKGQTARYAINWIKFEKEHETYFGSINKTNNKIDLIAKSIGNTNNRNVKEKIENTKKFVRHCLN